MIIVYAPIFCNKILNFDILTTGTLIIKIYDFFIYKFSYIYLLKLVKENASQSLTVKFVVYNRSRFKRCQYDFFLFLKKLLRFLVWHKVTIYVFMRTISKHKASFVHRKEKNQIIFCNQIN